MKYFLTFVFLFANFFGFSQEVDSVDTGFDEEILPCEDAIDFESNNFTEAVKKGMILFDFQLSECQEGRETLESRNRISSITQSSDTITFNIEFKKNCCTGLLVSIKIVDSLTWEFEFIDVIDGCGECFCFCCFSASLRVKNNTGFKPEKFLFNGESLPVSDTLIPISNDRKIYWETGKLKAVEHFAYDMLKYRVYYDESGHYLRIEYYDALGNVRIKEKD